MLLGNSGDMSLPVMFWDDGRVEGKGKDETGDYTIRGDFKYFIQLYRVCIRASSSHKFYSIHSYTVN